DVIGVVLVTGTHTGVVAAGPDGASFQDPLVGIPASNKKVSYLMAQVVTFDSANRVTSEYDFFDFATVLAQIGASKDPARPASDKGWSPKVGAVTADTAAEKANADTVDKLIAALDKHDA